MYIYLFISKQNEYSLQANVMIIKVTYYTTFYYDVIGYSFSDVTPGAWQV
jgi:hypothetical protein